MISYLNRVLFFIFRTSALIVGVFLFLIFPCAYLKKVYICQVIKMETMENKEHYHSLPDHEWEKCKEIMSRSLTQDDHDELIEHLFVIRETNRNVENECEYYEEIKEIDFTLLNDSGRVRLRYGRDDFTDSYGWVETNSYELRKAKGNLDEITQKLERQAEKFIEKESKLNQRINNEVRRKTKAYKVHAQRLELSLKEKYNHPKFWSRLKFLFFNRL